MLNVKLYQISRTMDQSQWCRLFSVSGGPYLCLIRKKNLDSCLITVHNFISHVLLLPCHIFSEEKLIYT